LLLCNGTAWQEIDVSSTYAAQSAANVAFSATGTIGSTNVQLAIEEVASEAANASNLTSGTVGVARGGTGNTTYAKGDLLVASAATTLNKLTAGTNGQVLRANSATATGLEWGADYLGTVTNVTGSGAISVANGTTTPAISVASASTSVAGVVQLSDSTSTTSSSLAATSTAVKAAYDLAAAALPAAGGTLTGNLNLDTGFGVVFEGTTADAFETTLLAAGPAADRTVYLPDADGTLVLSGSIVNADINASAAIADTKLATISTAGKVNGTALTGTIPSAVLGNSSLFVGTTSVALNRASANLGLTGISSLAMPGATSGTITVTPAATAGTTAITIPATSGTLITTGDTGSVTNTMLAGSIAYSKLSLSGSIVNADINASAAIADTKLATISTAGKVSGTAITSGNISTSGSFATTSTLAVGQSSAAANTDFDLAGTYAQTVVAVGALNIDCSTGNYFTKTINGASTFTVSNVPASRSYAFTLELTHTSGAITWFSGVVWPGGTAPTLTTGKVHLFMFVTDDGGTTWRASSLINY
jgi:hypothetical protein